MKKLILAIVAVLTIGTGMMPEMAEAKRVKWSCVAPNPLQPWYLVCTGSTSRP